MITSSKTVDSLIWKWRAVQLVIDSLPEQRRNIAIDWLLRKKRIKEIAHERKLTVAMTRTLIGVIDETLCGHLDHTESTE